MGLAELVATMKPQHILEPGKGVHEKMTAPGAPAVEVAGRMLDIIVTRGGGLCELGNP
jgi:hypothetical protein